MKNKDYKNIEDFLGDESFTNWVYGKNLSDTSFWENWLEKNPTKKTILNEARDITLGIKFNAQVLSDEKIDADWLKLEAKLKTKNTIPLQKEKKNYKKHLGIAASIVLIVATSLVYFNSLKITHKTKYGEILKLRLEDGSNVILNSNSKISYYKDDYRKIKLSGEAFFEVEKKKATNAKFWVTTNDLEVQVYGTSFNVNSKHQKTEVFLEEGIILLELKNGVSQKMNPGNFISYSFKEDKILHQEESMKSSLKTSWKDGTIIFEKLLLKDAIKKIEETYGLNAIFRDEKSKNKIITGVVPTTNLAICIKAIEKSVGVKITLKNKNLIINNK